MRDSTFIFSKVFYIMCVFTQGATVKQELKHEPVSTRVKMKIMPHLLRSRLAAECFPSNIQVRLVMFDRMKVNAAEMHVEKDK